MKHNIDSFCEIRKKKDSVNNILKQELQLLTVWRWVEPQVTVIVNKSICKYCYI